MRNFNFLRNLTNRKISGIATFQRLYDFFLYIHAKYQQKGLNILLLSINTK
jgi:hypothetical protein